MEHEPRQASNTIIKDIVRDSLPDGPASSARRPPPCVGVPPNVVRVTFPCRLVPKVVREVDVPQLDPNVIREVVVPRLDTKSRSGSFSWSTRQQDATRHNPRHDHH